jgi:hypothetical protein
MRERICTVFAVSFTYFKGLVAGGHSFFYFHILLLCRSRTFCYFELCSICLRKGLGRTLLQKVLKMKPSSGKLQFWEWEKTLWVLEHFVPRPYWYFTFLHAGNVFRHGGMQNNSMGEEHFVPRPCWYIIFLHAGNVREEHIFPPHSS